MGSWRTSTFTTGGLTREYRLYIPGKLSAGTRYPLLFGLHGGGVDKDVHIAMTGMEALAETNRFFYCCPDGTPGDNPRSRTWNAGSCCGMAVYRRTDDLAFLGGLRARLIEEYAIDDKRVYASGVSNGAMMAYRWAVAQPSLLAAVCGVAATMDLSLPAPGYPIPMLHIHGTDDKLSPWNGGPNAQGVYMHSVAAHLERWQSYQTGALSLPTPEYYYAANGALVGTYVKYAYGSDPRPTVCIVAVLGGGHCWPGGKDPFNGSLGRCIAEVPASKILWSFVSQFRR